MAVTQEHGVQKLKRIAPEQVRVAFKNTGLKPECRTFGDGVTCGCALTALAVESNFKSRPRNIFGYVRDELKYDETYLDYFIAGFDAQNYPDNKINFMKLDEVQLIGYRDGEAARKLIFGEGL